MRIFGTDRDHVDYIDRPGAYGVCERNGEVLVVRESSGIFLPGGGIEPDESPREALDREMLEETGYPVDAAARIGRAGQYTDRNAAGRAYFKRCHFYELRLEIDDGRDREPELPNAWIPRDRALEMLHEEAFRWALRSAG